MGSNGLWKAQLLAQDCNRRSTGMTFGATFLPSRAGYSVRAAAGRLGVNHSAVLRRIAQLEERLRGAHVRKAALKVTAQTAAGRGGPLRALRTRWKRRRTCWRRASSGATQSGARASAGDAGAAPRDTPAHAGLRRLSRVCIQDIEMEILSSGELANLTNREADVAIRVVYDRKTLPPNLHGQERDRRCSAASTCPAID